MDHKAVVASPQRMHVAAAPTRASVINGMSGAGGLHLTFFARVTCQTAPSPSSSSPAFSVRERPRCLTASFKSGTVSELPSSRMNSGKLASTTIF